MISAVIIAKDAKRCLHRVLSALTSFDEVILVDTGSTDNTLAIARAFSNVTIHERPFSGFGALRNEAAHLARHEWILSIDADEVLSNTLITELSALVHTNALDPNSVYAIAFRNYFNNKWIRGCGWHPRTHVRLYHRQKTRFSSALVHEGVITEGLRIQRLIHPIDHYPYDSINDFLIKMECYSTLFAKQWQGIKSASPLLALCHGLWAFVKSYFLQRGLLLGYEGFLISRYQSDVAYYKYLKLYHLNKESSRR